MKKILFVAFGAIAFGMTANASYLYWQLENSIEVNGNTTYTYGSEYLYAAIKYDNGESWTQIGSAASQTGYYYTDLSSLGENASTYSYAIEYFSSSKDTVAKSTVYDYASIQSYLVSGLSQVAAAGAMKAGAQATPEPTTGMLTLIGMALLGLRRKRV